MRNMRIREDTGKEILVLGHGGYSGLTVRHPVEIRWWLEVHFRDIDMVHTGADRRYARKNKRLACIYMLFTL